MTGVQTCALPIWDHEPRMPWQTDKYYENQRNTLRDSAYIRLHENRWVTSNETFFPIEWYDKGIENFKDYLDGKEPQSVDVWKEHPFIKLPLYLAVDTGMKHDCTAIVGVTADAKVGKVIQMLHKIWKPVTGEVLDLEETVEPYLVELWRKYNVVDVTCDPSQMLQIMNKLSNMGIPVSEFTQSEGGMISASQALFDLFHDQNLWLYYNAEVKEHFQNAVAQHTSRGFRIVKDTSTRRTIRTKVDAAVAMAMACYKAIQGLDFDAGEIVRIESPYGEYSEGFFDPEQLKLPAALRDF